MLFAIAVYGVLYIIVSSMSDSCLWYIMYRSSNIPLNNFVVVVCRSVDCYDMCVRSYFGFPVQSCADLTHAPGSMSVKKDLKTSDVVIEIHPPAVKSNFYQLNKFCKCVHAYRNY